MISFSKILNKKGELTSLAKKWFNLLNEQNLSYDREEPVEIVINTLPGNPNSTNQKKDWLFSLGWVPRTFDYVKNNSFITQNFFVSPNRIVAISSEANLDIVEKVMFVYNQLKNDNLAFITLVDELVKDDSLDIFDKFSQIVNSDYDSLQEVIKRVPSKYNEELLTVGKDHYMLVKGV